MYARCTHIRANKKMNLMWKKIINDQQTQTIYSNLKYPARMLFLFLLLLLFVSLANCKVQLSRALTNH